MKDKNVAVLQIKGGMENRNEGGKSSIEFASKGLRCLYRDETTASALLLSNTIRVSIFQFNA